MPTYPYAPPTVAGSTVSVSAFLNDTPAVSAVLRELSRQRYLADFLLTGRQLTTSGAIRVDAGEEFAVATDPLPVAPGAEYPRAMEQRPTSSIASISKWGHEVALTDEAVSRERQAAVERSLRKLANATVRRVDSVAMGVVSALVTQTVAAGAAWNVGTTTSQFRDLMLAKATIDSLNLGFEADTVVMTPTQYAWLSDMMRSVLPRETEDGVIQSGSLPVVAGLSIAVTTNIPTAGRVLVCDRTVLGGLGVEDIDSPEWDGDPVAGPEARVRRDSTGNDQWLLGARRPVVPYITEPQAGIFITGIGV